MSERENNDCKSADVLYGKLFNGTYNEKKVRSKLNILEAIHFTL